MRLDKEDSLHGGNKFASYADLTSPDTRVREQPVGDNWGWQEAKFDMVGAGGCLDEFSVLSEE